MRGPNLTQYPVRKKDQRVAQSIVLSIFIHTFLVCAIVLIGRVFHWNSQHKEAAKKNELVEIEIINLPKTQKNQQIVQSKKIEPTEKTKENAYLSEQNQIVHEQSRAKNMAAFRDSQPGGSTSKKNNRAKKFNLSKIGVAVDMKPLGHLGPGERSASSDYLNEVKEGAQTLLNTKEFKYFSFYQRVRQRLEQFWEPELFDRIDKMIKKGRSLAEDREHHTRLLVMLDGGGTIKQIRIMDTSGMLDLDQAAIEAFNRAGPFPNPPKGMVEADGLVRVEWQFVLKT